jgi:nicotinamidase-related amidase
VAGRWRYIYRAIDQFGQVVDVFVSPRRDLRAARRFFERAIGTTRAIPSQVVTDQATCQVHDIGRVVIVGQHTDCCVRHTSYDAFLRGFEVVVPGDATAVFQHPYRRSRSRSARSGHWTTCGPFTECGW